MRRPLLALAALLIAGNVLHAQRTRQVRLRPRDRDALTVNGIERTYIVRAPAGLTRAGTPRALVLVLHGGGGNAANAEQMTGFTELARREGFVVAYPDGTSRLGPLLTWNAGHCCGSAMRDGVDDVRFLRTLIDTLAGRYPIDPKRVYVTGMSNGGMMAHRAGLELSDRVAAVAPVVGALFGDERRPAQPVSVLAINGMRDEHVPFAGGLGNSRVTGAYDGVPTKPAAWQGTFWGTADACGRRPRVNDQGAFVVTEYVCPNGAAVTLVAIKEQGHAWPGGRKGTVLADEPSTAFDATAGIWEFLRTHPKR